MPIYMDVHESLGDATAEDVAEAHRRDLEMQGDFGVRFLTFWFNDDAGKAFCLVESPDADTAVACHKAAHGLTPHRIIEVSGDSMAGFFGEWQTNDGDQAILDESTGEPDTAVRAIVFTDIVGSTAVSSQRGDAAVMALVEEHDATVRKCLAEFGGLEVKHTGDGILASFVSVAGSVGCAVEIQRNVADSDSDLAVSIGISAGEPVSTNEDLFGASVNLSARLCDHASSGEILVSSAIKDLSIGKNFAFNDAGAIALKGFDESVSVFTVGWEPDA